MKPLFTVASLTLLTGVLSWAVGCGSGDSLGEENVSVVADTDLPVTDPPKVLAVSDKEIAAIKKLRDCGAEIDLDDAGHAQIVELIDSKAKDEDLALLSHLPCLEILDVTGGAITEAGLVHIRDLHGLQRLYLNNLPLKNSALTNLSGLTKLDVLSLRNTKIDDAGVKHLKKLKQLTVLNLSKTGITNESLKQVRSFEELDTLVLADTAATGEGFQFLRKLKKLRTLNVDRCTSLEGHLMQLNGMPEMRMLYVHGCTVPEKEVNELTDLNPRLAVFGD